jgi:UDP-N-acetylmuramoylalanine--D-glutamate ligase
LKKVLIIGAGESGLGCALLANKYSHEVFVSDINKINNKTKMIFSDEGINFEEESHENAKIYSPDIVIKSPGISDENKIIKYLRSKSYKIISEIEFASRYCKSVIIAVTGSNGKSTTSSLIHEIIFNSNFTSSISGNIGKSFSSVCDADIDYSIVEVSSFQLDSIQKFRPHIAILTAITPDHLDRYQSFEDYVKSKFRIAMNQTKQDFLIYDGDCKIISSFLKLNKIKSELLPYSTNKKFKKGSYKLNNKIHIINGKNNIDMPIDNFTIKGNHNLKNAMAAATVANLLKIRKETIRKSLEHFQGIEHRLENVLTINKVRYINDSKATNINATYYALESMESPTVWIVGGIDKGNDYTELSKVVSKRVKAIICLGTNNIKIMDHFENMVEYITEVNTMKDAVNAAYKISSSGDSVLLSPACASFDLFEDFEDRGRQFKEAVRKL